LGLGARGWTSQKLKTKGQKSFCPLLLFSFP
jgi:hypothetical protein